MIYSRDSGTVGTPCTIHATQSDIRRHGLGIPRVGVYCTPNFEWGIFLYYSSEGGL
jgi:coenzyme F420-reducing hydrogenase beta subunit